MKKKETPSNWHRAKVNTTYQMYTKVFINCEVKLDDDELDTIARAIVDYGNEENSKKFVRDCIAHDLECPELSKKLKKLKWEFWVDVDKGDFEVDSVEELDGSEQG